MAAARGFTALESCRGALEINGIGSRCKLGLSGMAAPPPPPPPRPPACPRVRPLRGRKLAPHAPTNCYRGRRLARQPRPPVVPPLPQWATGCSSWRARAAGRCTAEGETACPLVLVCAGSHASSQPCKEAAPLGSSAEIWKPACDRQVERVLLAWPARLRRDAHAFRCAALTMPTGPKGSQFQREASTAPTHARHCCRHAARTKCRLAAAARAVCSGGNLSAAANSPCTRAGPQTLCIIPSCPQRPAPRLAGSANARADRTGSPPFEQRRRQPWRNEPAGRACRARWRSPLVRRRLPWRPCGPRPPCRGTNSMPGGEESAGRGRGTRGPLVETRFAFARLLQPP